VQRLLDAGIGVAVMREVSAREESATTVAGDDEVSAAISEALADSFGTLQTTTWDAPVSGVAARITLGAQFAALARDDS
jgi:hypothetical protein